MSNRYEKKTTQRLERSSYILAGEEDQSLIVCALLGL